MLKIQKLLKSIDDAAKELQFNAKVFSASGPRVRATASIRRDVVDIQNIMEEVADRPKPAPPVVIPPEPKPIKRETPGFTGANAIPLADSAPPKSPSPPRSPVPTKRARPTRKR